MDSEISITKAENYLTRMGGVFIELFKHGSLSVEYYKPHEIDLQQPHNKDEIYVIAAGTGNFKNGDRTTAFKTGDFLFVPAGVEHQFENFTDDFATWVFFYGPVGGETP